MWHEKAFCLSPAPRVGHPFGKRGSHVVCDKGREGGRGDLVNCSSGYCSERDTARSSGDWAHLAWTDSLESISSLLPFPILTCRRHKRVAPLVLICQPGRVNAGGCNVIFRCSPCLLGKYTDASTIQGILRVDLLQSFMSIRSRRLDMRSTNTHGWSRSGLLCMLLRCILTAW